MSIDLHVDVVFVWMVRGLAFLTCPPDIIPLLPLCVSHRFFLSFAVLVCYFALLYHHINRIFITQAPSNFPLKGQNHRYLSLSTPTNCNLYPETIIMPSQLHWKEEDEEIQPYPYPPTRPSLSLPTPHTTNQSSGSRSIEERKLLREKLKRQVSWRWRWTVFMHGGWKNRMFYSLSSCVPGGGFFAR